MDLLSHIQKPRLGMAESLELGLLEWRSLVLICRFNDAERCIRLVIERCYYHLLPLLPDTIAPPVRRDRLRQPQSGRRSPSTATHRTASTAGTGSIGSSDDGTRVLHLRSQLAFVLQHAGHSSAIGAFGALFSRAFGSLVQRDVHLFPAAPAKTDAACAPVAADAEPVTDTMPRVDIPAVFTHLLNNNRVFIETSLLDPMLANVATQLCNMRGASRVSSPSHIWRVESL